MPSRLATVLLLVVLTSLVPRIVGGQTPDPKKDPASNEKQPPTSEFLESRTFELLIVGPDGEPVPKAQFKIQLGPKPKEWIFHRGELSSKPERYGSFAVADEGGGAAFEIPSSGIQHFAIHVVTPGFGPFWAQWAAGQTTAVIPDSYTVHLDAGVSIGGITVDEAGRPIAGVEVSPWIEYKKREGDLSQLGVGARVKSDENGKWIYHSIPAALDPVSVALDHPEYLGASALKLALSDYTVPAGAEPSRHVVVPRGETVTGIVKTPDGKPLAGARIRTKFVNSERETTTDENGVYHLKGCHPGTAVLIATAKGFGPETADVNVRAGMPPVDIQLPTARTIRIRAVDEAGRPLPKFRVFFRRWRTEDYGYGLGLQLVYANEQGVWEWNEAPADAFVADICPTGRTYLGDQTLVARDEEYVFTFKDDSLPATIFGSVIDQITGQPIPEFRVVPGEVIGSGIFWLRNKTFDGKDGKFYYKSDTPRGGYQFRIEARNHQTADSEFIASKGGNSNVLIQLAPGEWLKSKVMLPSGGPAAGATLAIGVAGTQIHFRNGDVFESGSYCDRRTTDANGEFEIPLQVGRCEIFVVHPSGWARTAVDPGDRLKPLELTPWAHVRGVAMHGRNPARDVSVTLDHQGGIHEEGRPNVSFIYEATTLSDGSFEWKRVFPGPGTVSREVKYHVTSRGYHTARSHSESFEFPPGHVTEVTIGGSGRPVTGKLAPPESLKTRPSWNFAIVKLESTAGGRSYCTAVQPEGEFRLEDIPEGEYTLDVELHARGQNDFGPGPLQGTLKQTVSIPAVDRQFSPAPIDLGALTLKAVDGE